MQEIKEMLVWSLGQEDPLEEEVATYSSILAGRIPWTEEPGGLQSMGLQSWTWLSNEAHIHTEESVQLGGFVRLFWELWRACTWMATPQRAVLLAGVSYSSKAHKERTSLGQIIKEKDAPLEEQNCHLPLSSSWHMRTGVLKLNLDLRLKF